jgi:hypothetical protein
MALSRVLACFLIMGYIFYMDVRLIKRVGRSQVIVAMLMAVVFAASLVLFLQKRPGPKRMFYFTGFEGDGIYKEARFLAYKPPQGDVGLFVDELLLGPLTDGYQMLFVSGTRAALCVEQQRTLYVDLTMDIKAFVDPGRTALPWDEGAALFKKNIRANFPAMRAVVLFINGHEIAG